MPQQMRVTMFDFAKPVLAQAGIQPQANWEATRTKAQGQVVAQLSREGLKPATVAKWHRIGSITGIRRSK